MQIERLMGNLTNGLTVLLAGMMILIGTAAALWPKQMSKNFGITADDRGFPLVISIGVRDIFMGVTVLILNFHAMVSATAYVMIAIGVVALGDFYTVFRYGEKKISTVHLLGAVFIFGFAAFLLY